MQQSFPDLVGTSAVAGLLAADQTALNRELSGVTPTLDVAETHHAPQGPTTNITGCICLEPDLLHQASVSPASNHSICSCLEPDVA